MKVSEFRDICDALARFASVRETAKPPESLIGVQVSKGELRLIAGSDVAGMVVMVGPAEGEFGYTIQARPFLQSAKALTAKDTVDIIADTDRLTVKASGGGSVKFNRVGKLLDAGFPRKPKDPQASVHVDVGQFEQISQLFTVISAKVEVPTIQRVGDTAYISAVAPGDRPRYASLRLDGCEGPEGYSASGYLDFWEALKALEHSGTLKWGRGGVSAISGPYECYSAPYLVSKYDPKTKTAEPAREPDGWPILEAKSPTISFTLDKKTLIALVKGQSPHDEHNRITLEVDNGSVEVRPYGSEEGQSVPASTQGSGVRSVNAEYLLGLLNKIDSKEITVGWGGQPALSLTAKGYERWTILLAPVMFS